MCVASVIVCGAVGCYASGCHCIAGVGHWLAYWVLSCFDATLGVIDGVVC